MRRLLIAFLLLIPCADAQFIWGDYRAGWRLNATCTDATVLLIDASGEKVGGVFRAPKTGNITAIRFKLGTVTTADDLTVSLQDVDLTTGDPDGTQDQTATVTVDAADDGVWKTATFGAARAVTGGDAVAYVIEVASYVDANFTVTAAHSQASPYLNSLYAELQTGGVWAKQGTHGPMFALIYDDGYVHVPGVLPVDSCALTSTSTSTSPDEAGIRFQVPRSVVLGGAIVTGDMDGDYDVVLYSAADSVLASTSVDANHRNASGLSPGIIPLAAVTLTADTTYRLVVKPTTTTGLNFFSADVPDNAILGAWPLGVQTYYTSRADAGSWTDTNNRQANIGLYVTSIPAGGGSTPTPTSHTFIQ